jgi:hypothetical protein
VPTLFQSQMYTESTWTSLKTGATGWSTFNNDEEKP